jgi:hypothetical protein
VAALLAASDSIVYAAAGEVEHVSSLQPIVQQSILQIALLEVCGTILTRQLNARENAPPLAALQLQHENLHVIEVWLETLATGGCDVTVRSPK